MALSNMHANPEFVADTLTKGVARDLELMIKKKLMDVVDPIVSELARDLADKTAASVHSYYEAYNPQSMQPVVQVRLVFNNKNVDYVGDASKDSN